MTQVHNNIKHLENMYKVTFDFFLHNRRQGLESTNGKMGDNKSSHDKVFTFLPIKGIEWINRVLSCGIQLIISW
jgi:hypothetical protein